MNDELSQYQSFLSIVPEPVRRGLGDLGMEALTKFMPKRELSERLAGVYKSLGFVSRFARVSDCGTFLEWHITGAGSKLHRANFCKDRLCPMCNWRRSLKIFSQVSRIMDVLEPSGYQFLFLTLTIRNVSGDELSGAIDSLFQGWNNLYRKTRFKRVIEGTFRSLEVTKNHRNNTYHPHIHSILAVKPGYFQGGYFISQKEWGEMWRECCGLDYDPIIDVRRIRPDKDRGISGAVAEVAKYAVKSSAYLGGSERQQSQAVADFLRSLSGRRLCSYTGVFAQVRKALQLDDVEDGDLVQVDGQDLREDVLYAIVRLCWRAGAYILDSVHVEGPVVIAKDFSPGADFPPFDFGRDDGSGDDSSGDDGSE